MKIKSIRFAHEIENLDMDNVDVLVEFESGYTYVIVVTTPKNLDDEIMAESVNFISPRSPMIIVKKLTKDIIEEAIFHYAENDAYWLKLCQFGDEIDISVLNKLEKRDREE